MGRFVGGAYEYMFVGDVGDIVYMYLYAEKGSSLGRLDLRVCQIYYDATPYALDKQLDAG